jgi:hypothetical protein
MLALFQPDPLLSAKYFENFCSNSLSEPEKRLMLALLKDAVASYQEYVGARDRRGRTLFREAEDWIMDDNWDSVCSFDYVCEVLGFQPGYIRSALVRWKEKKIGTKPKLDPLLSGEKGRKRRVHNRPMEIR